MDEMPIALRLFRAAVLVEQARDLFVKALESVPLECLPDLPAALAEVEVGALLRHTAYRLRMAAIEEAALAEAQRAAI